MEALERLKKKARGDQLNIGFDPKDIADMLEYVGYVFEGGAREFGGWSKKGTTFTGPLRSITVARVPFLFFLARKRPRMKASPIFSCSSSLMVWNFPVSPESMREPLTVKSKSTSSRVESVPEAERRQAAMIAK